MFKTFAKSALAILVVLGLTSLVSAHELYQRDSDFVIQYHSCFSTQIGFDILQNNMDALFTEYINRYNSDAVSETRVINTSQTAKLNDKVYKVTRGDATRLAVNDNGLDFSVDFTATSGEETLTGEFKIYLDLVYPSRHNLHDVPQLILRVDKTSDLAVLIFTFEEGQYFDQPSATRMFSGFVRTLNEYTKKDAASTYIAINQEAMNLNVMLNCHKNEVETMKASTVASDTVEFGMSNNIMNMVYPYSYDFRLNTLVNRIMMFNPKMYDLYEKYDLRQARGLLRLTKSSDILDQLVKKETFTVPKIQKISQDDTSKDKDVKSGDIMRVVSSAFLEFQDYTNKTLYDYAVAPFDITWDIKANIEDREDGTQKFDAEFVKTKFKFKKCEFLFNNLIEGTDEYLNKKKALPDGDEDFDEDDDEEQEDIFEALSFAAAMGMKDGDKRKIKISNYQSIACGAKGMIPSKMKENKQKVQEFSKKILDFILDGFKHLNDIPEGESYQLQCAGIDLSRPKTRLESDRIVVSMKLKNKGNSIPEHLKNFCDKEEQELLRVDPRTFTFEQNQQLKDWIIYENHNQNFNYLFEIGKRGYVQNAKSFMDIFSPVVQAVSAHEYLQDYCREHYPKYNTQRCAFVHTHAKAWEEFNQVLNATHLELIDKRNNYDPNDIDMSQDEYIEWKGMIFSNFDHYRTYHYNIRSKRMDLVLQAQQGKKFKLMTVLEEEMIREWKEAMQPQYDALELYCDEHEKVECDSHTAQINQAKKIDVTYVKNILAKRKQAKKMVFWYNSCEDSEADCAEIFDPKTRTYITDPKEKLRIKQSMDDATKLRYEAEEKQNQLALDEKQASFDKYEADKKEKEAELKAQAENPDRLKEKGVKYVPKGAKLHETEDL